MSDHCRDKLEDEVEELRAKIKKTEDEVHVQCSTLKSLEAKEHKASQREDSYEETIRDLSKNLKDAENRATEAERQVVKLQKEVDRLEDVNQKKCEELNGIKDELDNTLYQLATF